MAAVLEDRAKPANLPPGPPDRSRPRESVRSIHRFLLPSAYVACLAVFLAGVARSWHHPDGFTSLIRFGSRFDDCSLDALKALPHIVVPNSSGYDGQFYAQLALSPTLQNPQLPNAIDNMSYRSRRILFSWTAWLLGLGQPAWVIQAYALQNVLFWLGAAVLLLRWLPPTRWFHFCQWAAILFSQGWLVSVNSSLLDGPALFLMLLAIWLSEQGRPFWSSAVLGVSLLGKETNLLGTLAAFRDIHWKNCGASALFLRAFFLVFPVSLWLSFVAFQFGFHGSAGSENFAVPFGGWSGAVAELKATADNGSWRLRETVTVLCMIATFVQIGYFAAIRRWSSLWWRMGSPYVILGICLGPAVMDMYAFPRVLLPMLAAYNLSLKPTSRGWMLLLAGNLHVVYAAKILGLGSLFNVGS